MAHKDKRSYAQRIVDEAHKAGQRGQGFSKPYWVPLSKTSQAINQRARCNYDKGLEQFKKGGKKK